MAWASSIRPEWLVRESRDHPVSAVLESEALFTTPGLLLRCQESNAASASPLELPTSLIRPLTDRLVFLLRSFLSYLCVLEMSSLLDTQVTDIFTHSAGCPFSWWTASGTAWKLFNFTRSHLSIVGIISRATIAWYRMWVPCWSFERTSLLFSPNRPKIWIIPECLWSIWSCFWCRVNERGLLSFSYRWGPSLLSAVCWRTYLSSKVCFWHLWGNKSGGCGGMGLYLSISFHQSFCLFLRQSHTVFVTMALQYDLKPCLVISLEFFLI